MRPVLRLLSTRYGVALALTAMLVVVVAAFRGVAGSRTPPPMAPALEPSRSISVEPSGGNDGAADDDPDLVGPGGASSGPATLAPAVEAQVRTVVTGFATAWVHHTGVPADQWHTGIDKYATPTLVAKLKNTDPSRVPADAVAGGPTLVLMDALLVEATVPLDVGTLRLRVVASGNQWKVDSVDWDRPS